MQKNCQRLRILPSKLPPAGSVHLKSKDCGSPCNFMLSSRSATVKVHSENRKCVHIRKNKIVFSRAAFLSGRTQYPVFTTRAHCSTVRAFKSKTTTVYQDYAILISRNKTLELYTRHFSRHGTFFVRNCGPLKISEFYFQYSNLFCKPTNQHIFFNLNTCMFLSKNAMCGIQLGTDLVDSSMTGGPKKHSCLQSYIIIL